MGDTIVGVQFGIANPDDIIKRSVVEVTTDKTYQSGQPVPNGVFDSRFGVIENGKVCPTCKQTNQFCPGHFGHITLARPVYLYQFFDTIEKVCNLICLACSKPLVYPSSDSTATGGQRLKELRDMAVKLKQKGSDEPLACPHCASVLFAKVMKVLGKAASLEGRFREPKDATEKQAGVPLQTEMVLRAFQRITDEDCIALGFNPKFARPEWMICTVLAVPPLTVRPSVVMDDNQKMEDDLTHKLIDIIRNNQRLRDKLDKGESAERIDQHTALVQYDVATYVDNDIKGMAPAAQRSGRPLRTLKARFGAKTGRVRGNLMGKRVDFSARSVITPDANIDLDELGVPEEIAVNLTFPEIVSVYNRDRLLGYIKNGPDKHPGAKTVFLKQDKRAVSLRFVDPETIDLREGDVVHRHLLDGDIVLFNRQPSLHKASMEAHRVRVLPYSTFRLNVSATRPYNADFDGDEMNMHVPQSIAAATELRYLASVLRNIISPRTNSPIIQLFQDTMTGIYRMSLDNVTVPEVIAMNILARIKRPFSRKTDGAPWTGAELISAAFPIISVKGGVTIENGQLIKGILKKSACTSLVHVVYNDFSPERAGQLINDIQSVVTQFNLFTGFSVGTADLISNIETQQFVDAKLLEARREVANILSDVHSGTFKNISGMSDGEDLEDKVSSALKKVAADINNKVVESLPSDNRMIQMVNSGSKGGPQNITQMVATLGQQLIEGRRVQYTLQDRTLPHFARYDDGIESRGFVQNSFVSGLMPAEFFFHAQAGREGLIDTAVKTSDTGYIQRRLMKTMEDQHLEYDGSVRNVTGSIVQFVYGEDGVDTQSIEDVNIDLAGMSTEQIYREYALSPKDLSEFVSKSIDQTPDLVDELLVDRDMLVRNVFRWRKNDRVSSPVNIARMLTKYSNPYGTKTDLTPQTVVERLTAFIRKFPRNRVFHALLRYYLAPKKAIINHRLTEAMFGELMAEIEFRYLKAQCHAGEMVGVLAAQSIGEPTTQLTLNTFHSAGTVKANATSGVPRIEELLSASSNPKRPGNTAYLLPGVDTKNEAIAKMKELQKTTLRDISKSVRIYYDPFPLASTTAVNEDREILELYERFTCPGESTTTSPWVMRVTLSAQEMVSRNTLDLPEVADKISNNFGWATVKCVTSNKEADKMILRIEFDPTVVKNPTVLRNLEDKILDIPLTDGPSGIGRVFLRTLKNEMVYDEGTASYAVKEQYVLDLEGKNLPALMVFPGIDMTRCFSNDIHEINEVFGIETARLALYEEFNEVFSTEKVNYHHLAVLVDTMTFSGRIVPVNRFGMKKNETGVLAKSSFEETSKVMFEAAVGAEYDSMRGVSANIMFGQKPPCGTGFVDILVDESRLPEGPDGIEEPDRDALDQANKTISETPAGDCRMEDILMAF